MKGLDLQRSHDTAPMPSPMSRPTARLNVPLALEHMRETEACEDCVPSCGDPTLGLEGQVRSNPADGLSARVAPFPEHGDDHGDAAPPEFVALRTIGGGFCLGSGLRRDSTDRACSN